MTPKLEKTSVQLPPDMARDMNSWPGLTRSEAIRLAVERQHYLSCYRAEETSGIASRFEPILMAALEDFDYKDYKTIARALPAIVAGFLQETNGDWSDAHGKSLDPSALMKELEAMHHTDRIGVLDCIVAQRRRREGQKEGQRRARRRSA